MADMVQTEAASVMILDGKTAADLMTPHVLALAADRTVDEAIAFLVDKKLHAVPVVDAQGAPIGVLSRSDIVAHDRLRGQRALQQATEASGEAAAVATDGRLGPRRVQEIMTPVVHAVKPDTAASTVVQRMLVLGVHRLFVTASDGALLGVISSLDVLRHLHEPLLVAFEQVELLCANDKEFAEAVQAIRELA
jgi:CBS-domain-containing membrane protein